MAVPPNWPAEAVAIAALPAQTGLGRHAYLDRRDHPKGLDPQHAFATVELHYLAESVNLCSRRLNSMAAGGVDQPRAPGWSGGSLAPRCKSAMA